MEQVDMMQSGHPLVSSIDPERLAQFQADAINKLEGRLDGYECPECNNRGIFAYAKGSALGYKYCACMDIRRCVLKMEKCGLTNVMDTTFDSYEARERWQMEVKQGAMDYANSPEGWILFCGQQGSGKKHLCSAICRQLLLSGYAVRYMNWEEDAALLKAVPMHSVRRKDLVNELKKASFLFIDGLFKVSSDLGNQDISIAFDIIEQRNTDNLATIISTECTPAELFEIDAACARRIVERAGSNIYHIKSVDSRNYRLRNVLEV